MVAYPLDEILGCRDQPRLCALRRNGRLAAKVVTTAICRNTRKKSRILSAACSVKRSAQSPPCKKSFACGDLAQHTLELARLTREDQRRKARNLALDLGQRRQAGINGHLLDRFRSPARR
jgi:hypothetical protein